MTSAIERFSSAARALGIEPAVQRFPEDTRTAQQAAEAIGCELGQIVKSLIFAAGDGYALILTSGQNRVNEAAAAALLGIDALGRADADGAREATGFAIGGIPPFGHTMQLPTAIDQDLLAWPTVWAAAGAPDSVFPIAPDKLAHITNGIIGTVALG